MFYGSLVLDSGLVLRKQTGGKMNKIQIHTSRKENTILEFILSENIRVSEALIQRGKMKLGLYYSYQMIKRQKPC